jgi:hypothetical protein
MLYVGYSENAGIPELPKDNIDRCPHGVWVEDPCQMCGPKRQVSLDAQRLLEAEDLVRKAYRTMFYYHRGAVGPEPSETEDELDEWFARAAERGLTDRR